MTRIFRGTSGHREGWLGEIAGLEATLAAAEQKLQTMKQLNPTSATRVTPANPPPPRGRSVERTMPPMQPSDIEFPGRRMRMATRGWTSSAASRVTQVWRVS